MSRINESRPRSTSFAAVAARLSGRRITQLVLALGMIMMAAPGLVKASDAHVMATAPSCTEYLHPFRTVTVKFPALHGSSIEGGGWITADTSGEIGWEFLALDSNDSRHELFTYEPKTHAYAKLPMKGSDNVGSLGLLGISTRWIVFVVMQNLIDGSDWRIVARNRATGKERVIARGAPGGVLSGQFSLDGNMVVWAQPGPKTMRMLELNLATNRSRTLDSAPAATNEYDWVRASGGHVVWEWNHSVKGVNAGDILEASESGGKIMHVTTDGKGSQPSLSWPRVAYLSKSRFGAGGGLVVQDLLSGNTIQLPSKYGYDDPQIGGSLVVWRPTMKGSTYTLGLYSIANRRLILMRQRQMTIDGVGFYTPAITTGTMAAVSSNAHQVNGTWVQSEFHLVILSFHGSHPFHQILRCG